MLGWETLIDLGFGAGAIAGGRDWTRCKYIPVRSAMPVPGHRRSSPARRQQRCQVRCSQSVLPDSFFQRSEADMYT